MLPVKADLDLVPDQLLQPLVGTSHKQRGYLTNVGVLAGLVPIGDFAKAAGGAGVGYAHRTTLRPSVALHPGESLQGSP